MTEVKPEDLQLSVEKLQQHPELMLLMFLAGCLLMLILAGFLTTWTTAIVRWSSKQTILSVEPWTPRVWGLIDILLAGALVVVAQTIGLRLWAQATGSDLKSVAAESEFPLSAIAVGSVSYLVAMLLMLGWMMIRYGANPAHLGFNLRRMLGYLGLGVAAAVMWIPIVWIIMIVVSVGFSQDYNHPLLEQLSETPSVAAYLLATFSAVVVAPITEEFLFRVLLQGWLQSLPWSQRGMWWFFGASQGTRDAALLASGQLDTGSTPTSPAELELSLTLPYAYPLPDVGSTIAAPQLENACQPPVVNSSGAASEISTNFQKPANASIDSSSTNMVPPGFSPPLWPVFVSGTLFGLAHWGYGLSFVPLIFLGIILGLLYRAKHSIWPCYAVHFTLNFVSMFMLGISLIMQAVLK